MSNTIETENQKEAFDECSNTAQKRIRDYQQKHDMIPMPALSYRVDTLTGERKALQENEIKLEGDKS